jgi:8-oxo-dGTP pyrophosphatase MutT (NUDIX family)
MTFRFDDAGRLEIAHRCAAFSRLAASDADRELTPAAVAITLVETAETSGAPAFLLTRRASSLRMHRGQWALPGGRCDPGETAIDAALRELDEEVGLRLGATDVLGVLDDYPTRSGYLLTPVVLWGGRNVTLRPNPQEVAAVHRIALTDIAPTDVVDFVSIPESSRQVIRIRINGSLIHAPTAAVIYQFRELLAGRTTRVAELEQPVFAWR